MKIPRYMYANKISVGAVSLTQVARAVEIEAAFHRRNKNKEAAWALKNLATDLYMFANGQTFAEAFQWPKLAEREKP